VLVLAAVAGLVLANRGGSAPAAPPGRPSPAPPFVGLIGLDAATGLPGTKIPISLGGANDIAQARDVIPGFGFLWVTDFDPGRIYKVSPESKAVVAQIPVVHPKTAAAAGGDLWVLSGYPGQHHEMVRVDPKTNAVVDTKDMEVCCGSFVVYRGSLWALGNSKLFRVDPLTGRAKAFDMGGEVVAAGAGRIWALHSVLGTITSLDAHSGKPDRGLSLTGESATEMAFGFGALWVVDTTGNQVLKVPIAYQGQIETIPVGLRPTDVAIGQGFVWVANSAGKSVSKIEPQGARVERTIPALGYPVRLVVDGGTVWVADVPSGAVFGT